jgi:hypothetical protein
VRAARRSATTTSRAGAGRLGSGDRMEASRSVVGRDDARQHEGAGRLGWWSRGAVVGIGLTSGGSDRAWIIRCVGILLGGP